MIFDGSVECYTLYAITGTSEWVNVFVYKSKFIVFDKDVLEYPFLSMNLISRQEYVMNRLWFVMLC